MRNPDTEIPIKDVLADAFQKKYEDEYWESLIKSFDRKIDKNFNRARSVILDINIKFEEFLNLSTLVVFWHGVQKYMHTLHLRPDFDKLIDVVSKVEFYRKVDLVVHLGLCSIESSKIMLEVNRLRVFFAHSKQASNKSFRYFERNSIFEVTGIREVEADFYKVQKDFVRLYKSDKKEQ